MTDQTYSVNNAPPIGTILVVDDCAGARRVVCAALSAANLACLEADDGQAALDRLKHHRFDLMVTDLQMPRMDGFALLASLSGLPGDRRPRHVVVCSAMLEEAAHRVELDEADALLSKPASPAVLLRTVLGLMFAQDGSLAGAGGS